MRRFFVTGTDTGVGKTQVAAALLELMAQRQLRPVRLEAVREWRFVSPQRRPSLVARRRQDRTARRSGCTVSLVPWRPPWPARAEGRPVSWSKVQRAWQSKLGPGVVEGAGGLRVPLTARHDVIDLARLCGLPVVLVARAGLGTINHSVLSLEALCSGRALGRRAGAEHARAKSLHTPEPG